MKIVRLSLSTILLLAGLFQLSSEEGEGRIPRRIRIIEASEGIPPMVSAILYSQLTKKIPLVISKEDETPHNEVEIRFEDDWKIVLNDRNGVVDVREFPPDFFDNPVKAAADLDEVADAWTEHLGLVLPDVSQEIETFKQGLAEEVSFEERLITPFQATLWLPLSARQAILTGSSAGNRWLWQWPLRGDFAWYFRKNLSVTASFRFEYGNHISFGIDANQNISSTLNLMLMPGLGMQVRTIGKVSAEFGLTMFFGAVHVTAEENLNIPSLPKGESMWVFYPVLSLEPSIVWSPTTQWAIKFRLVEFNINLSLLGTGGVHNVSYGTKENWILLNFLQIGAAYRW